LHGHTNAVNVLAFSPDGLILASASNDRTARVWESSTGRLIATLHGHPSWVWSLAFSPDGEVLASGGYDGTIKLWDARRGVCLDTLTTDGPYARMKIGGVRGITAAQRASLKALGAIEESAAP
jgi:WD40 repeat protein